MAQPAASTFGLEIWRRRLRHERPSSNPKAPQALAPRRIDRLRSPQRGGGDRELRGFYPHLSEETTEGTPPAFPSETHGRRPPRAAPTFRLPPVEEQPFVHIAAHDLSSTHFHVRFRPHVRPSPRPPESHHPTLTPSHSPPQAPGSRFSGSSTRDEPITTPSNSPESATASLSSSSLSTPVGPASLAHLLNPFNVPVGPFAFERGVKPTGHSRGSSNGSVSSFFSHGSWSSSWASRWDGEDWNEKC